MLCKDNMTNFDYKSKKIMQNTFFLHFPPFYFYFLFLNIITKTIYHEMHECYAMQILKIKKTKTTKKHDHKEQRYEAQGPHQKDSIRLSLLHPKLFSYNYCIGVIIHIRMMSNCRIGLFARLAACNLKQFERMCPIFPQK